MSRFSNIENKLDKIKKAIGNNGIERINVWIDEDDPIRVDLIYRNDVKHIFFESIEEYLELLGKYKDVEIIEFIGVKKPKPDIVVMA